MKNVRSTFRVLALLRSTRLKKGGLSTLMIRVTINKDKFEISSQLSIDPKTWDAKAGKVSGRSKQALETNAYLTQIHHLLHQLYQEIQQSDGYVTVDRLRNRYLGCLLLVLIHGADVQDRNGIRLVLPLLQYKFWGNIKAIIADGGYSGHPIIDWVKQQFGWKLQIIKRDEQAKFRDYPQFCVNDNYRVQVLYLNPVFKYS